MAASPEALRLPSDQSPLAAAFPRLAAWATVAAAWKSPVWSVVEPEKPPVCTSTQQVPCVVKGLVPETVPRRRCKVAERIVAPSGIAEVSKETTVLYCLSLLSSPARRALVLVALSSSEPPALEVSVDSSTQPSWAAAEVKVTVVTAGFTTCGAPLSSPLLSAQPAAPVKAAVTTWLPTASADVLNAAWPVPSTGTLDARTLAPSVNVTVPAGTPLPEVTVAVNVTD